MATNAPIGIIQKGIEEGKLNASKRPVTTALKSLRVFVLLRIFLVIYSKSTQEITLTALTAKALGPKSHTDVIRAEIALKKSLARINVLK